MYVIVETPYSLNSHASNISFSLDSTRWESVESALHREQIKELRNPPISILYSGMIGPLRTGFLVLSHCSTLDGIIAVPVVQSHSRIRLWYLTLCSLTFDITFYCGFALPRWHGS